MYRWKTSYLQAPAWLFIVVGVVLLIAPIILTGKVIYWGTIVTQFLPWRVYAWQSLLQGRIPLWTPLVGAGAPLLANYQSAVLYPPNWISFLMYILGGVNATAWAEAILLLIHLGIAGVGMVFLMKELGFSHRGQRVSGLAYGMSSYIVTRGSFVSLVAAVAWMPWVILFIERLLTSEGSSIRRSWLGLTLVIGLLMLAGHAQTAWYVLLLAGAWAITRAMQLYVRNLKNLFRRLIIIAASVFVGILLASVQLFPTYEYLQMSPRATEVDYEIAMTYSFWPWRLLTFFAPDLFGNPRTGDYVGYASYWEDAAYIGLLPLLLAISVVLSAVWNLFRRKKSTKVNKPHNLIYFSIIFSFLGMILALGKYSPVFPFLYQYVPTFDMFKSPARYLLWTVFGLAILAGVGADAWRKPTGRWLYWSRLGLAAGFATTIGAGIGWIAIGDALPTSIRAIALAGVFGIIAGLLNLSAPSQSPKEYINPGNRETTWELLMPGFIIFDLLIAGWGMNPALPSNKLFPHKETFEVIHEDIGAPRIYLPEDVEYAIKFERYFLLDEYLPPEDWTDLYNSQLPNINMLSGTPSLNNFDPLVPARYARWMEELEMSDAVKSKDYLNLSAVGLVGTVDSARKSGVRYEEVQAGRRIQWFPCAVFAEDGEDALDLIGNETINLSNTIILEGVESAAQPGCAQTETEHELNFNLNMPGQILIQTHTSYDGWLLLADTWYPGWKAFIDDEGVDILHGDYLFRAVWLPVGEHTVTYIYQPRSFLIGIWVSITGWLIMGGFIYWHIHKSRALRGECNNF